MTILGIVQPYQREESCIFRFIFNVTDVGGDLAAVEAASSTGILELVKNNMKAIQFDQASHIQQTIQPSLLHSSFP